MTAPVEALDLRTGRVVHIEFEPASEEEFLQQVRGVLTLNRWLHYHTRRSRGSDAGFPDELAIRRDRLLAIELKLNGGKPTARQSQWLAAFGQVGEAYLWTPRDWPTILETLR